MTARPDTRYPGPTLTTRVKWLLDASPSDYLLALSVASASLPVIGKHLEPLGGATAMSIWGVRHMPDLLGAAVKSWFTPGIAEVRKQLDHKLLNKVEALGLPTLENLSRFIFERVQHAGQITRVSVHRDSCNESCTYFGPQG